MAMITRTFKTTEVDVLMMNVYTNDTFIETVIYPTQSTGKNSTEVLLKKIRKERETEAEKVVALKDIRVKEELRAITPEAYIANSVPVPEEQAKREERKNKKEKGE